MDLKPVFLSPHGRMGRIDFLLGFAAVMLATGLIALIPIPGLDPLAGLFLSAPLVWPLAALQSKRLHDMGLSGWLQALPLALSVGLAAASIYYAQKAAAGPIEASLLDESAPPRDLALRYFYLAWLVILGFAAWLGIATPQPYANRFGGSRVRLIRRGLAPEA